MSGAVVEGTVRVLASDALDNYPEAVAVGFKAAHWDGKPTIAISDGRAVPVFWCPTVLEFRERLGEATQEAPAVLLTNAPEDEIGLDVVCLLAGQRLRTLGVWEPLMAAFNASTVAPKVRKDDVLGRALMRAMPSAGYTPAPNGVLTEEHAWREMTVAFLGEIPASAAALLDLVSRGEVGVQLMAIEGVHELLPGLTAFLSSQLGPAAQPIMRCVAAGHAKSSIGLGLVSEVLFAPDGNSELGAAIGRFEQFFGGHPLTAEEGRSLADAATKLTESVDEQRANGWFDTASKALETVRAGEFAWRSSVVPQGFEQRLERFGATLILPADPAKLEAVTNALAEAKKHRAAQGQKRRIRTCEMAARLWLFLTKAETEPKSFEQAARVHLGEGGLLDLAREAFDQEEPNSQLANALSPLVEAVDERRRTRSLQFAKLLAAATDAASLGGCIGVEDALKDAVAPLAKAQPTLLVLLDGLSEAVHRALRLDLARVGWTEVTPAGVARRPMVAALPSLTNYSRASFFSGKLATGSQAVERDGMEAVLHSIGAISLRHKAALSERDEIGQALSDHTIRVVGVVVNAIDDQLDKGDQLDPEWSVETIGPLGWLLADAAAAGRVVVLAGDHGNVLERGSEHRAHEGGGARWRLASGDPASGDEVLLSGPRVVANGGAIIAPAVETLRYKKKTAGYHGGATPQEMITPLVVLTPSGLEIDGWQPPAESEPDWWLLVSEDSPAPAAVKPTSMPKEQSALFGDPESVEAETPGWVTELLQTSLFRETLGRIQRPPDTSFVVGLLAELDRRGFVAPSTAVARALAIPEMRVAGMVSSVTTLLNVEGYQVLTFDRGASEVRLDRDRLRSQFGI